jgi:serine/threonine-protein kinase
VGDVRILGPLGKGGMAEVFRGLHEALQREVAVKVLSAVSAASPEVLSRFRREALALAAFRHQHIVTLYDLIEKNDGWYLVMELVDGPTLLELLKEQPLPPEVVAVLGLQLCRALEHAHFQRVVHRDLKPSNVMISKRGETKLMDFGIAQNEDLERLTQVGQVVGTPAYMSPEQISGAQVDARSDLFSLGVVLYEALSGSKPFTGATAGEVFSRVVSGTHRPLRKAAPGSPRALNGIIARLMAGEPTRRYQDAAQARRAFEALVDTQPRSPEAVLVTFLRARQRLTESEALLRLSRTELTEGNPGLGTPPPRRWGLSLGVGVALGFLLSTAPRWWPPVGTLLQHRSGPTGTPVP